MNFIDIEFLPCESSIHSPNEPEKPFQEDKIVWKRPKILWLLMKAKAFIHLKYSRKR